MPSPSRHIKKFIPFFVLLAIGIVMASFLMNREWSQMKWEIPGAPDEYPLAQLMRPWLISIGCFLPCIAALIYSFAGIMDRYITRLFLSSFFLCTGILTVIFILGDFAENASNLGSFENPFTGTMRFYTLQLPMVLNLVLPYTLLLGVLWTLTKLSSSSEITGMLQSGRSLLRITTPILIGSCFVAVYFGIFGFHWAPNATLYRKLLFSSLSDSKKLEHDPNAQTTRYRNDIDNRIWNIRIPPGIDTPGAPLQDVHIEVFSAPGQLDHEIFARFATWDPLSRTWSFHHGIKRTHPPKNSLKSVPQFDEHFSEKIVTHYKETPWQLISPLLNADTQGTPQIMNLLSRETLNDKLFLSLKTEGYVRIARIFSCIILAFIAIPSAITFQRRSVMAGVGVAIFLAATMILLYEVFPIMAAAGRYIPPILGAWLPNIIYVVIAIYLFQTRLSMRTPWEWLKTRKEEAKLLASIQRDDTTR